MFKGLELFIISLTPHLISPPERGGVGGAVCTGQHRAALPAGALGH